MIVKAIINIGPNPKAIAVISIEKKNASLVILDPDPVKIDIEKYGFLTRSYHLFCEKWRLIDSHKLY